MLTLIDKLNDCLIQYFKSNGVSLFFEGSCLHNDMHTETIEFSVYSDKKPIKDFLINLFNQIGFDVVSHNFKFNSKNHILTISIKFEFIRFDITKDEMYELLAVLKLKGY